MNILDTVEVYSDTWKITFYFVASAAVLIGLLWTFYQIHKNEKKNKNKLNENTIYNKSYDAIENENIEPKRKNKDSENKIVNYYDVYQNENKRQNTVFEEGSSVNIDNNTQDIKNEDLVKSVNHSNNKKKYNNQHNKENHNTYNKKNNYKKKTN